MLPFVKGEIWSEITRYEPPEFLEEDFHGAGMLGHLAYEFHADGRGTILHQREKVTYQGFLRLFEPLIYVVLSRRLKARLEDIKRVLESGWVAPASRTS